MNSSCSPRAHRPCDDDELQLHVDAGACHAVRLHSCSHLISHRPCSHIRGTHTTHRAPSRGLLASTPRNIDHACIPGVGNPAACCYQTRRFFFFLRRARTCLLCFKTQTCVLLSSRQTTGAPWAGACPKRLRRRGLRPHFIKRSKKKQEPSACCISSRVRAPQIPGVRVSVPSRGCYAARCQCDAPGLAGWPNRTVVRAGSHSRRWTAWYHSRRQIYSRGGDGSVKAAEKPAGLSVCNVGREGEG